MMPVPKNHLEHACRPPSAGRRDVRGFTIIELVVAIGITVVMAAIMLAMTTNIMNSWSRASGSLSAQSNARIALDFLEKDLERAIFRHDGNVWFAVDTLQNPNVWQFPDSEAREKPMDPTRGGIDSSWDPDRNRFGWGGVWLRFFTADPDVNAVSYQIVRRNVITSSSSDIRYMLYRSRVTSQNTFAAGYNIVGDNYNPGRDIDYLDGNTADGKASGTTAGTPGEIQQPNRTSVVANNIVDFGVRLFWKTRENPGDPNSEIVFMEIFPDPDGGNNADLAHRSPTLPGNDSRPEDFADGNSSGWNYQNDNEDINDWNVPARASTRVPHMAEIHIRVLTDEGARLLAAYEAELFGEDGEWWDIIEEHSKHFTRRVVLQNTP